MDVSDLLDISLRILRHVFSPSTSIIEDLNCNYIYTTDDFILAFNHVLKRLFERCTIWYNALSNRNI
jgi:hypothetical protein